jgi:hypothetical protein
MTNEIGSGVYPGLNASRYVLGTIVVRNRWVTSSVRSPAAPATWLLSRCFYGKCALLARPSAGQEFKLK